MDAGAVDHFWTHGWVRIARAFSADAARRMRDTLWRALAEDGIHRDDPTTWKVERPTRLQHLKQDPVFETIGGDPLMDALETLSEGLAHERPKDWGAFFVAFPTATRWRIPCSGWHIDAQYASALRPTHGLKTHALVGDVVPRGGATLFLSGSHRLIHAWFKTHPPPHGAKSAELRTHLRRHPYIRALHTEGDIDERIDRFMGRAERVEGIDLKVVENTGDAGDVIVAHPLLLHVATANNASEPRFLLSGGVSTDQWGWGR